MYITVRTPALHQGIALLPDSRSLEPSLTAQASVWHPSAIALEPEVLFQNLEELRRADRSLCT